MKLIAKLLSIFVCLLQASYGLTEPADNAPRLADAAARSATSLCTSDGKLDVLRIRVLRDDITTSEITHGHLITLVAKLSDGPKPCIDSLSSVNSTVLASLHTLLADRLLASKDYNQAISEYTIANGMFDRASLPDVMWLRALEGKAKAEINVGHLAEARETASRETKLARSWAGDRAKRFMLVQALKAEASIYLAEQQPEKAGELTAEAEKLESLPD